MNFAARKNITAAASKFKELESEYGACTFGKFAKHLLPNRRGICYWERDLMN